MRANLPRTSHALSPTLWLRLVCHAGNRRAINGWAHPTKQPSEAGLSLIECLVAIVIITLTVVSITPPIMLATATRIQSRKADLARQIAQGEIDRIRVLVERGGYIATDIPPSIGTGLNVINATNAPSARVAPTTNPSTTSPLLSPAPCGRAADNSNGNAYYPQATGIGSNRVTSQLPSTNLVQVDVDGDCRPEYVMQVFRTDGYTATGEAVPFSFAVGVRVYTYYPGQTFPALLTDRASLILGVGPRETSTNSQRRPMATLQTRMTRNDSSKSLCQLRKQASATETCTY